MNHIIRPIHKNEIVWRMHSSPGWARKAYAVLCSPPEKAIATADKMMLGNSLSFVNGTCRLRGYTSLGIWNNILQHIPQSLKTNIIGYSALTFQYICYFCKPNITI